MENRGDPRSMETPKSSTETILCLAREGGTGEEKGTRLKQFAPYEGKGCWKKENHLRQEASINTMQLAESFGIERRAGD